MVRMSIESSRPSQLERVLIYAAFAIIGLSLISIIVSIIVGMADRFAVATGFWPVVYGFAFYGLPIGFVLMIVAIAVGYRRRRSATRKGGGSRA